MAERELYRAVLEQATEDLCNGDVHALDWIHSRSCVEYCHCAGLDYRRYLRRSDKITQALVRRHVSGLVH